MILRANGRSGQLEFDGRSVTITHKGYTAGIMHGTGQGSKVIPLSSITAIQFKPATAWTYGFIQLSIGGEIARNYRPGSLSGLHFINKRHMDIAKDENAILFEYSTTFDFQNIADTIRAAIDERYATPISPQIAAPSAVDGPMEQITKLGALLNSGLITQAEFDSKKTLILSRI